tara:strand:- start:247 stop:576 length:330 start_codon:yes stop_codon:yes gene_type:complete
MAIKLTLLKSGELLISDAKEIATNEDAIEPYAYILDHPHVVLTSNQEKDDGKIDVMFRPWILISKDTQVVVPTDWVVTVVDPIDSIKQMYIDKSKTFTEPTFEVNKDGN